MGEIGRKKGSKRVKHEPVSTPADPNGGGNTNIEVVTVTDFDPAEDMLAYVHDADDSAPVIAVEQDPDTGAATVLADGVPVAHAMIANGQLTAADIALLSF